VHRVSNHQVHLEWEDGQKIDLKRLVKRQTYGTVSEYQVWVWDPKHQERFAVRLVLSLLPRQQAMQARTQWRIELFFKRLKQGLHLHLLPVRLWKRARASVHLSLIVWSLQEQEAQDLSEALSGLLCEPEVGPLLEQEEQQQRTWVISHWGWSAEALFHTSFYS
jgi:hypothetical protein